MEGPLPACSLVYNRSLRVWLSVSPNPAETVSVHPVNICVFIAVTAHCALYVTFMNDKRLIFPNRYTACYCLTALSIKQ